MDTWLHIPELSGALTYATFYAVAFCIGAAAVFLAARRSNVPEHVAVTLIAAAVVGAIIGSKILTIPFSSWAAFAGAVPSTSSKTLLGGLLGGSVAVALARRWLRLPTSAADLFAWAVILAVPVGRLGCLVAGCCFGRPTEHMWAMTYGAGTKPYLVHASEGRLASDALVSLPVHPVPIYEILFFLILGIVLWRCRRLALAPGNRFYLLLATYGVFRFLEEFVRHSAELSAGLSPAQIWLIPAGAVIILVVARREFVWRNAQLGGSLPVPTTWLRSIATMAALVGLVAALAQWLVPLERFVAVLILVSGGVIILTRWLSEAYRWPSFRPQLTAALILPVGVLIQEPLVTQADTLRASYLEIGLSGVAADHIANVWMRQQQQDCGPATDIYEEYPYAYRAGGVDLQYVRPGPRVRTTLGLRLYGGNDQIQIDGRVAPPRDEGRRQVYGANPFLRWDGGFMGFGVGVHAGQLRYLHRRNDDPNISIAPMVSVRLGDEQIVYVHANIGDGPFSGAPSMWWQAGAGVGVPASANLHFDVRAGISPIGLYASPRVLIAQRYAIATTIAPGDESQNHFGVSVSYRIPLP